MGEVIKPMSDEELLVYLKKFCFNQSMTADDLKCPKGPFIFSVFQSLLSAIHVNVDSIYTLPFEVAGSIENIEFYEEILPVILVKILMTEVMQMSSGITDLSIRDIIEPKPKRTKKVLVYLIALWRDLLIKDGMYEKLEVEYQAEINHKEELLGDIELMKQQISDTAKNIEKNKELLCVFKENRAKFELQVESKGAVTENYQKLKSKKANYLKKLRELDVQIESQKIKHEELDQKIMKSPERFNSEKEQLRQRILEIENKIKEIQLKNVGQQNRIDSLDHAHKLLTKSSESVKIIHCLSEQVCEVAASVGFNQSKYKEEEGNAKRMRIELEKEEEQKYLNEQWLAKENLNGKKRIAAIKEIMIINKKDGEKVESTCEHKEKAVCELQELLKSLEQTKVKEKEQHEAYSKKFAQEYSVLKKSFIDYTQNIGRILESEFKKNVDPALLDRIKEQL